MGHAEGDAHVGVAGESHPLLPSIVSASATRMMFALQTVALPLAFWFKPVCVCVALFWCVYPAEMEGGGSDTY